MSQTLAEVRPDWVDSPLGAVFEEMRQSVEAAAGVEREITETLARLVGLHQRRHEIGQSVTRPSGEAQWGHRDAFERLPRAADADARAAGAGD